VRSRPRERTLDTQATINQMEGSTIQDRPAPRAPSTQTVAPSSSSGLLRYWPIALVGGLIIIGGLAIALIFALAGSGAVPIVTETPVITESPTEAPTLAPTATKPPTQTPTKAPAEEITDEKGVVMRLVPAGEFTMGGSADTALAECQKLHIGGACGRDWFTDEEPPHTVYLDAFYMDKYEVSNAAYRECVNSGACQPPTDTGSYTRSSYYGNSAYDDYPVIFVDWYQAKTYCEWRGARLPTEAEWEKAARGTDGRTYPWGNGAPSCSLTNNYLLSSGRCIGDTTEVGSYESGKSPYGLYDLAGNVLEWVADWYGGTYYSQSPSSNPTGPASGPDRVLRGGSWSIDENYVRSANRLRVNPTGSDVDVGFRCVLSP